MWLYHHSPVTDIEHMFCCTHKAFCNLFPGNDELKQKKKKSLHGIRNFAGTTMLTKLCTVNQAFIFIQAINTFKRVLPFFGKHTINPTLWKLRSSIQRNEGRDQQTTYALKYLPVFRRRVRTRDTRVTRDSHIAALIAQKWQEQERQYPREKTQKNCSPACCTLLEYHTSNTWQCLVKDCNNVITKENSI